MRSCRICILDRGIEALRHQDGPLFVFKACSLVTLKWSDGAPIPSYELGMARWSLVIQVMSSAALGEPYVRIYVYIYIYIYIYGGCQKKPMARMRNPDQRPRSLSKRPSCHHISLRSDAEFAACLGMHWDRHLTLASKCWYL